MPQCVATCDSVMIRIAVDAMGGDRAPDTMVDGAVAAARHLDAEILLVGAADRVEAALVPHGHAGRRRVRVVDAPDVVEMTDAPAAALRRKTGSREHRA